MRRNLHRVKCAHLKHTAQWLTPARTGPLPPLGSECGVSISPARRPCPSESTVLPSTHTITGVLLSLTIGAFCLFLNFVSMESSSLLCLASFDEHASEMHLCYRVSVHVVLLSAIPLHTQYHTSSIPSIGVEFGL